MHRYEPQSSRKRRGIVPALVLLPLIAPLFACKPPRSIDDPNAGPVSEMMVTNGNPKPNRWPTGQAGEPETRTTLVRSVARVEPEEASQPTARLKAAAARGDSAAALRLGDIYGEEIASGATPSRDLFGRRIAWYRRAADLGNSAALLRLARTLDFDANRPMPDAAMAYYIAAARQGQAEARRALAEARDAGRLSGSSRLAEIDRWSAGG